MLIGKRLCTLLDTTLSQSSLCGTARQCAIPLCTGWQLEKKSWQAKAIARIQQGDRGERHISGETLKQAPNMLVLLFITSQFLMEASTFTPVLVVKARSGLDMAESFTIRRVGFEEDNPDWVF